MGFSESRYSVPGVLSLMVVLGLIVAGRNDLEPLRPGAQDKVDYSESTPHRVEARLWQDPFHALEEYDDYHETHASAHAQASNPLEIDALRKTVAQYATANGPLILLGVALPGGDYADLIERRRRSRYAVVSALSSLNYLPLDSEHLHALRLTRSDCPQGSPACTSLVTPYEMFEYNDQLASRPGDDSPTRKRVIVFWLEDGDLQKVLLKDISCLASLLSEGSTQIGNRCPTPRGQQNSSPKLASNGGVDAYLLGPYASKSLQSARQLQYKQQGATRELLDYHPGLRIINWSATNRTTADFPTDADTEGVQAIPYCPPPTPGEDFYGIHSTIASDQSLICAVTSEVHRRLGAGNDISRRIRHVLLVAESDTHYASFLRKHAREAFTHLPKNDGINYVVIDRTYLRGIDGQYPGHEPHSDEASDHSSADERSVSQNVLKAGFTEQSQGTGQLDYLRRMARSLRDEHSQIDAIGVLGSDPYDKVLVMQALREEYPRAIYFTTDLYSLFLRDTSYSVFRNLLVSASHNLKPASKETEGLSPPLRDSYQTSLFEAVHHAIAPTTESQDPPSSRVFEIGHGRYFEVSGDEMATVIRSAQSAMIGLLPHAIAWLVLLLIFIGPLMSMLKLVQASIGANDPSGDGKRRTFTLVAPNVSSVAARTTSVMLIVLFAAAVGAPAVTYYLQDALAIEPWSLSGGVSFWPTLGIAIAVLWLCYQGKVSVANQRELLRANIDRYFIPRPESDRRTDQFFGTDAWSRLLKNVSDDSVEGDEARFSASTRRKLISYAFVVLIFCEIAYLSSNTGEFPPLVWLKAHEAIDLVQILLVVAFVAMAIPLYELGSLARRICKLTAKERAPSLSGLRKAGSSDEGNSGSSDSDERYIDYYGTAISIDDEPLTGRASVFLQADDSGRGTLWKGRHLSSVINGLVDLRLVEIITDNVQRLYYFPVFILTFMGIASLPFFEAWPITRPVLILVSLASILLVVQALKLDLEARHVQKCLLANVEAMRVRLKLTAASDVERDSRFAMLDLAEHSITSEHEGAFLPTGALPLVRILILAVSAVGLILSQAFFGAGFRL